MSDRYCPYCGELVPSNSVTCPKCYGTIPNEPGTPKQQARQEKEERRERRRKETPVGEKPPRQYNSQTALALAVIPGFIGLLGLGQIYRDYRSMKGWFLMLLGLVIFTTGMMLLLHWTPSFAVNLLSSLSAFPVMLIYSILYIFAAADILIGRMFRIQVR